MAYEDSKEFFHDVEYEEEINESNNQYALLDALTTSKLSVNFFLYICRILLV